MSRLKHIYIYIYIYIFFLFYLFICLPIFPGSVQRILVFTAIHVAVAYCPDYQSLVNGIVTSGSGVGLLMSAPLITFLTEKYSFRGAALIFSGICLNVCVAAMVFHPVKWHMDTPYLQFEDVNDHHKSISTGKEGNICATLRNILKKTGNNICLFKSPHAVILSIIVCFNIGIFLNIWTFVPFVMSYEGYTADEVSLFISVAGGCNLSARIVLSLVGLCVKQKSYIFYIMGSLLSIGTLIGT